MLLILTLAGALAFVAAATQAYEPSSQGGPAVLLELSRTEVYYLSAIPSAHSPRMLWFDWDVAAAGESSGVGVIQYSTNQQDWSNLLAFKLSNGSALGRQFIDSSWAKPHQNFLRAVLNQTYSNIKTLSVFDNYGKTVIPIISLIVLLTAGGSLYLARGKIK